MNQPGMEQNVSPTDDQQQYPAPEIFYLIPLA
jgi:hypothetical protein